MAVANVPQVVETVRRSRLLLPPQLAELQTIGPRFSDPYLLIQELLVRGWLTPQQAHRLFGPPPGPARADTGPRVSYRQQKAESGRRWLKWNLIGMLFLIAAGTGIYFFMQFQGRQERAEVKRLEEQESQAKADFAPLAAMYKDRYANKDRLRDELLAFRIKYPEVPQALQAADLLAQLPSPLDRLIRDEVPQAERDSDQPRSVVAVLGERAWRHWGAVRKVAASPDGTLVASAADDGKVHVWDRRTARIRVTLPIQPVLALSFVADGKFLAVGDAKGQVTLWEPATGKQYGQQGPVAEVKVMAVSPLGTLAASAGADATVKVWDLASGEEKASLTGHRDQVLALAFSPDGKLVASGGADALVRVWTVEGQEVMTIEENQGPVRAVSFARDSQHVAYGGDEKDIRIYTLEKKKVADLKGHEGAIAALSFARDGHHLVSASDDLTVKVWLVEKETDIYTLQGHLERVNALAFLGTALVTGSSDGTVRLWSIPKIESSANAVVQQNILMGHQAAVSGVLFLGDGTTIASTCWDRTVRLWNVPAQRIKATLGSHDSAVLSMAVSGPAKRLATGSFDGAVKLWDTQTNAEAGSVAGHQGGVLSIAFSPGGDTFAVGVGRPDFHNQPGEFKWWGSWTQAEVATLNAHATGVSAVAFAPDGQTVFSAGWDGQLKAWNRITGKERASLTDEAPIDALAVSPDGRILATANENRQIKLWELPSLKPRATVNVEVSYTSSLAFSPDGKMLSSSHHDGMIQVWDAGTLKPLQEHKLPGAARGLAWAPDSRHLATANANGTVYVVRLGSMPAAKK